MFTILGAGLSGLSIADHFFKRGVSFQLFEAKSHGGGHIHSEKIDGFTWDEGPHVSFTNYDYVKNYFASNCNHQYLEFATNPANYYDGNWIDHPAQSNMYQVPEPLREECVADLIAIRSALPADYSPQNYQQWIDFAFGEKFAAVFPGVYTKKYWTTDPRNLTTDWIGKRIFFPAISDMAESTTGPLNKHTHYISTVRYPKHGGFYSFIEKAEAVLPVRYGKKLKFISFLTKQLYFDDGAIVHYDQLINTLPLPALILNSDAPTAIKESAKKLKCSQLLLVNVVVNHPPVVDHQWIYVYDAGFYATRINFTDLLSPANGEDGGCGIQVEVYFSEYTPITESIEEIAKKVISELLQMGLVKSLGAVAAYHTKWIDWANVIFDQERESAQNDVFNWLETMGMKREPGDLDPMTSWEQKEDIALGGVILAGRFAQWKYYWTDDCVMRAKYISENINC